jgi:hypothetical protein
MSSQRWVESPRLHVHLIWLLEQLEPHRTAIAEILVADVVADFFCFSEGATPDLPAIPRSVRNRADTLGFSIEIDHYDTSGDQDAG